MSRLRKGKKYKGAGFAGQFKSACAMKSPLYKVAVAGEVSEPEVELPESPKLKEKTGDLIKSGASKATTENIGDKDIVMESSPNVDTVHEDKPDQVEKKIGSGVRRTAREDYFTANKEKQKEAAETKAAEEKAAADAEEAEEAVTYRNADGEMVFKDDYTEGSSGKERRGEHRGNKAEIKEEYKEDKARLKEMRDSGKISKKEYKEMLKEEKAEKKGLKKSSKTLKKSNRQNTKAAKKAAKRARKGK